jgi:uncharacterized tellurite resistance protein B-like protein
MSLLKALRMSVTDRASGDRNPLVEAVLRRLNRLPPSRAEFVAAFAGLLVRVAYADLEISAAEQAALDRLLAERTQLSPTEAEAVTHIVMQQASALGGIQYALLTRTFNRLATQTEKEQLIDCLYAIATAGSSVSAVEDDEVRAVARALLLSHTQFIAIRHRYKDQLEVIQDIRKLREGAKGG